MQYSLDMNFDNTDHDLEMSTLKTVLITGGLAHKIISMSHKLYYSHIK